ncbi:MAG: hypothetical protein QOG16_1410 [Actinomycetota bacterium]|nr:hypothetical protein [Actinomycetota bacterium]
MSDRFCPQCQTDVQDVGGFCLLGHPLAVHAPVVSLTALRAEVDKAFEDARVQVAHALGDAMPPPPPPPGLATVPAPSRTPVPSRTPAPSRTAALEIDTTNGPGTDPITDFAPAPRMDWGPERQGLLKRRG